MASCRPRDLIVLCLFSKLICIVLYCCWQPTSSEDLHASPPPASSPHDPAFQLELDPNKKIVILFTSFRGGSSFLGQLFDHNPAVQYLYEPFHDQSLGSLYESGSLLGARADHTDAELRMLYLQQIMHNCSMYATPFYEKYEYCSTEGSEEHLARFNSTECVRGMLKTGPTHQEICRFRDTTVLKVIRVQNLSDILKIGNIRSANVKIIHLLRNPIPMLMSRRTGGWFFFWDHKTWVEQGESRQQRRIRVAWESYNYCYHTLRNLDYLETQPWLQERYMRLTHSELSLHPSRVAENIYSFLGLHLTDHLREVIVNTTSGAGDHGSHMKGALNTMKNSSSVLENWKRMTSSTIKLFDLFTIEAQCSELFRRTGSSFAMDTMTLGNFRQLYSPFAKDFW